MLWMHEEQRYAEEADIEDMEVKLFGGLLDEAMTHDVLPDGGMPDTVIDVEEWMIALFRDAGQECIADYWQGNLDMIRGYKDA